MSSGLHSVATISGPDSPFIVFGNSLMTDLGIWDAQVEALGGRYNVIRYDQRGHGASPIFADGYGFDDLGRDLLDVLDAHDVERCVYVGLSMGVPTGLAAYTQAPERFAGLFLIDGQASSTATSDGFWSERIETAQRSGMDRIAAQTTQRWLRSGEATKSARLHAMIASTPVDGFVAGANCLRSYDQSGVLKQIAVPTWLVAGADDGALPQTMQAMSEKISGSKFHAIADCGHIPNFERPREFNAELIAFLASSGLIT